MPGQHQPQPVPVRLYQTENDLVLAAPLPGMGPRNIRVTIAGQQVAIWGDERGERQDDNVLLVEEWAIGPYHRELTLPVPVNGERANASYGNGVLVLAMPKLAAGEAAQESTFQLQVVDATRGRRVGHRGHAPDQALPAKQPAKKRRTARVAGKTKRQRGRRNK